MTDYIIIDEPKARLTENLIVNPLIILLAGVFLPLIWSPPLHGRIWLPFLWLALNGYALGSPTLAKEIALGIAGFASWFGFIYAVAYSLDFLGRFHLFTEFVPYIRIINQGIFFIFLYLIVFLQAVPYALHEYLKEQRR